MGNNVKSGKAKTAADPEIDRFVLKEPPVRWSSDESRESRLVVVRENSICVARGVRRDGVTNGKPWSRYKNTLYVASWRSGDLRTYQIGSHNRVRWIQQTTSDYVPLGPAFSGLEEHLFERHLGRGLPTMEVDKAQWTGVSKMVHHGAFPILSLTESDWQVYGGMKIGSALRLNDGRAFVETLFGKKRYRKDLLSAVAGAKSLDQVVFARELKDAVPVDWIIERLKSQVHVPREYSYDGLAQVLAACTPATRRKLTLDFNGYTVRDTIRLFGLLDETNLKANSWKELHDDLAAKHRKMGRVNRPIEQTKLAAKIDGREAGRLTIASAKQTDDLERWGNEMSNCIASYGSQAVAGTTNLFGVYEADKLLANLMVDKAGNVVQLFGRFNIELNPEDDAAVRKAVKARG